MKNLYCYYWDSGYVNQPLKVDLQTSFNKFEVGLSEYSIDPDENNCIGYYKFNNPFNIKEEIKILIRFKDNLTIQNYIDQLQLYYTIYIHEFYRRMNFRNKLEEYFKRQKEINKNELTTQFIKQKTEDIKKEAFLNKHISLNKSIDLLPEINEKPIETSLCYLNIVKNFTDLTSNIDLKNKIVPLISTIDNTIIIHQPINTFFEFRFTNSILLKSIKNNKEEKVHKIQINVLKIITKEILLYKIILIINKKNYTIGYFNKLELKKSLAHVNYIKIDEKFINEITFKIVDCIGEEISSSGYCVFQIQTK